MLQQPDIDRDALTMNDHVSMEVVSFGDLGRGGELGDACPIARVSTPTTPTVMFDLTAQQ